MKKKNILLIGFALFVLILFVRSKIMENKIMENKVIVCGEIKSIKLARSGWIIDYYYIYNSNTYYGNTGCSSSTKKKFDLGKRKIFVAVEKSNPNNGNILENSEDFEKFKTLNQDTLNLNCKN